MSHSDDENNNETMRDKFIKYLSEGDKSISFDMYARDLQESAWLRDSGICPGLIISSAGGVAPFQAEGLIHGHPFYMRDEDGSASIKVGLPDGETPYLDTNLYYSATVEHPNHRGFEGQFFILHLLQLLDKLEKAPYLYEFPVYKIEGDEATQSFRKVGTERVETYPSWGKDEEDAFLNLKTSLMKKETNWDEYPFHPLKGLSELDPAREAVNSDERVFPEELLTVNIAWSVFNNIIGSFYEKLNEEATLKNIEVQPRIDAIEEAYKQEYRQRYYDRQKKTDGS